MDPDLYVFGPSESVSVIICTDPDLEPSSNKQKVTLKINFLWFSTFELKKTSVLDPDSLSLDPKPAFKAIYQSGSGSRVLMTKY
jgi:hypothetical protein